MLMTVIVIAGISVAAAAVLFIIKKSSGDIVPIAEVVQLPDVMVKNTDNQDVSLSSFRGRPLVISLWASWCAVCASQLSELVSLSQEFGGRVVIAAMNRKESSETIKRYADQMKNSRELIWLLDADDALYQAVGGFSMPEILFIDKDGIVRGHIRGPMGTVDMHRYMEDLIAY